MKLAFSMGQNSGKFTIRRDLIHQSLLAASLVHMAGLIRAQVKPPAKADTWTAGSKGVR
jgi:hypothetical protein